MPGHCCRRLRHVTGFDAVIFWSDAFDAFEESGEAGRFLEFEVARRGFHQLAARNLVGSRPCAPFVQPMFWSFAEMDQKETQQLPS